jgi:hypothetical protein
MTLITLTIRTSRSRTERIAALDDGAHTQLRRKLGPASGLARVWPALKRVSELGFPRRFPIVQFPNLPLIIAFLAGEGGRLVHGPDHAYTASVSYLAMTIWAYEELTHGVNWFRHLLGVAYAIIMVVRVAHALPA